MYNKVEQKYDSLMQCHLNAMENLQECSISQTKVELSEKITVAAESLRAADFCKSQGVKLTPMYISLLNAWTQRKRYRAPPLALQQFEASILQFMHLLQTVILVVRIQPALNREARKSPVYRSFLCK
ncbi:hypothetical protein TNCV_1300061 [Trichonephila clavipes]|nr:hypothetical protein TNCV_1300061 [Trichonephila clavipes]